MIKMHLDGITVEVEPKDAGWFKRAGYVVVPDEKPAPVEPVAPAEDAPVEKAPSKRGKPGK